MKSVVVFIAVCIVGYWIYEYYQQNPDEVPSLTHSQKGLVTSPIPSGPQSQGPAPDLTSVPVTNGTTLTHARVKDARPNTMVFACDQGLFEVSYDRLPPAFRAYYAPPTPTPSPTASADSQAPQAPAAAAVSAWKPQPQRSSEEETQAVLAFNQRKASLEQHQRDDMEIINRWYKQSTFDPNAMPQSQFDSTKADYDATTAQLGRLVANGP
jgi:hypothetical protein